MLELTEKGKQLLEATKDYDSREIELLRIFTVRLNMSRSNFIILFGENIERQMRSKGLIEGE